MKQHQELSSVLKSYLVKIGRFFTIIKYKVVLSFFIFIIFYIKIKSYIYPETINYNIHNGSQRYESEGLLDLNQFFYVINNNLCIYAKPEYIIIITSHINNVEVRNIIRYSYPKDLFQKLNIHLIFLLGMSKNDTENVQLVLERENIKYNDIIQGNFIEAYRNLTYKHVMGLKWVNEFCSSVKYIIKMDDDIVINYYKLFELLVKFKSSQMIGCMIKNMKPIRVSENKWYVPFAEYADSVYPTFLSGWIYIATIGAVRKLLHYSKKVPYFWIDDVYVTGILAKHAGIIHTDIRPYFRYDPDYIPCCIDGNYVCDFVAAPSGGNYNLQIKLNHHIWECKYKKHCLINNTLNSRNCIKNENAFSLSNGLPHIQKLN